LDINQKFRSTLTKDDYDDFLDMVVHFGIFNDIEVYKKGFEKEIQCYFEAHQMLLQAGNEFSKNTMTIDFTDMIYLPYAWKLSPMMKYEFLFIDECQDLSKAQFAVVTKYVKKDGRVLAVGDPRQSIYGFTGADIKSFDRVKNYTKAKQLPLTVCFRCPQKTIEIAKTIRPDMTGIKTDPGVIETIRIEQVVSLAKPGNLIISRLRAPMVILVFSFIDKNIEIKIHEDEVQAIINELKILFKPKELNMNLPSFANEFDQLRITVYNRQKWMIEKNAERIQDPVDRSVHIQIELQYVETKLDFLHKKYELWKADCPTIMDVLKRIKKFISSSDNPIQLSTIHRAKGLEEDTIFILNYDELPYTRMDQQEWQNEQEMNLKYVAVTRAKKKLFLVETYEIDDMIQEGSLFDDLPFD
jgi:superfamily I DNA/RNA helicase